MPEMKKKKAKKVALANQPSVDVSASIKQANKHLVEGVAPSPANISVSLATIVPNNTAAVKPPVSAPTLTPDTTVETNSRSSGEGPSLLPSSAPRTSETASSLPPETAPTATKEPDSYETSQVKLAVPVYSLVDLNPETPSPWAFIARVFFRGDTRTYTNLRTSGSICELFAADTNGAIIRITLFNEAVTAFRDTVAPGVVCYFSLGRIKLPAFHVNKIFYEATFGTGADIHIMETQDKFAAPILGFVSLAQVKKLPDKSRIAVIGIVRAVGGLKKFSSKEGRAIEKREFALVDDSNTKVFCTLWGQVARDFEAAKIGRVYALLAVSISDYSGSRSLNLNGGASILPHPAISRSDDLNTWYTTVQPDHAFAVLP